MDRISGVCSHRALHSRAAQCEQRQDSGDHGAAGEQGEEQRGEDFVAVIDGYFPASVDQVVVPMT
jgi:hypothetical protein